MALKPWSEPGLCSCDDCQRRAKPRYRWSEQSSAWRLREGHGDGLPVIWYPGISRYFTDPNEWWLPFRPPNPVLEKTLKDLQRYGMSMVRVCVDPAKPGHDMSVVRYKDLHMVDERRAEERRLMDGPDNALW